MKIIFLDMVYLQALVDMRDDLHPLALQVTDQLRDFYSMTSEMVLTELLNALCSRGSYLRQAALNIVDELQQRQTVEIVPQTPQLFADALSFYRQRKDKRYSLTDCASMLIMKQRKINDVLTFDRHFQQEGFNALLRSF